MARREGEIFDPFAAFNFLVEIDGVITGGFSECTGLDSETDPIDYRTGNESNTVRKLPGLYKQSNIVLKRGMSTDDSLFRWRRQVVDGEIERKNVSIVLYDETGHKGEARKRWDVTEAWPCKWVAPEFKASANEIAIETVELCHEGITTRAD